MSYAVEKRQASSPAVGTDGPPSTATVYDFICLFTHDLRRKQKRWQDGKLKYHSFNKKVVVYDDRGHLVGDAHWDQEGDLAPGDELSLDRGMALVQVEDCTGEKQQDLTELLDKRAREVEKRRQIAASKRPTQRGNSLAGSGGGAGQPQAQRPHLPLSSLVQSPGRIGRAAVPAHSPFEARRQGLHQKQPPRADSQPTVAAADRKRRASPSPPGKAGFARNLFGTTLNLSSCPGPELMAARARAPRQRMLSQAAASSTPQEEEEGEEPVQSSPFFEQEEAEATPSRPVKERRTILPPATRHPIATARSVMREAEELGSRNEPVEISDEDTSQRETATKRRRKEARKPERQLKASDPPTTQHLDDEEDQTRDKSSKKQRSEDTQPHELRRTENKSQRKESRKYTTNHSPPPDPMLVDKSDEVEEVTRPREKEKEPLRKNAIRKEREKKPPPPARKEHRQDEPKTTLRMRSRQKRGLLMLQQPSTPSAEPPAPMEDATRDRGARMPPPEPRAPSPPSPQQKSAPSLEEEVVIHSSAPPEEDPATAVLTECEPPAVPMESSSDDVVLQVAQRRTRKRRTVSPPTESAFGEEAPQKKPVQQTTTKKRTIHDGRGNESGEERQSRKKHAVVRENARDEEPESEKDEDEEMHPRKRSRAAKRSGYSEEPEPEQDYEQQQEEATQVQGPRIARLSRKGIRSREIIGYVGQAVIPGPFASAAFRFGGLPVPPVSREASDASAKADAAPKPASVSPVEPAPAPARSPAPATVSVPAPEAAPAPAPVLCTEEHMSVIEEKPVIAEKPLVVNTSAIMESLVVEEESIAEEEAVVDEKPLVESSTAAEAPMTAATREPEPVPPQTDISTASEAVEAIVPTSIPRRNVTLVKAPPPVVRSNSSSNAIAAATTRKPNATKLEALSAPEITLAQIPETLSAAPPDVAFTETEKKANIVEEDKSAMMLPPVARSFSAVSEMSNGTPRIANPASRGKKAARREDAAGLAPQVIVPFEPVQPVVARGIMMRPGGGGSGGGRGRIAAAGPLALGPVLAPPPPVVPAVANKAASGGLLPGFTSASGGTWSRHAHDLLGMTRPERGRR